MRKLFSFPTLVNEISARIVAGGVVAIGVLFLVVESGWVLVPLTYGFAARVLTGPSASPLGQLATRVITPLVPGPHQSVPGPPKRFAQAIGLTFTSAATIAWSIGALGMAKLLIIGLVIAAGLEAGLALCLGCMIFNRIWGCADCGDLQRRAPVRLAE